jgi:uncharacterized protein YbjT (DUF2867 family)
MDFSMEVWLFTCASGKQCSRIIPRILQLEKPPKLRLAVHSQSSCERMKATYPTAECFTTDLTNPQAVAQLVAGVTTIYHIGPPLHERELSVTQNVIDAAVEQKAQHGPFQHFVFSSVLHTQMRKLLHHEGKRHAEEYLMESGLNWTILQPSRFIDDFPYAVMKQKVEAGEKPVFTALWNPASVFTFTALDDLGDAVSVVLRNRERHYSAIYEIVSTRKLASYHDVCAVASAKLGTQIEVQQLPFEKALTTFLKLRGAKDPAAVDHRRVEIVERMLLDYERRGLVGNPNVLEWLLEREGLSLERYFDSLGK